MRRSMSIRLRLTLLYTAILALTVITLSTILVVTQTNATYAGIKANLIRQVGFLASGGNRAPDSHDGPPVALDGAPPDGAAPGATAPASGPRPSLQDPNLPSGTLQGRWMQIRDLAGEITGQTLDLSGTPLPLSQRGLAAVQDGDFWFETATVQDEPLLIYTQQVETASGTAEIVQVAFPIGQSQQSLYNLRLFLIIGSSFAVLTAFALGWVLAGAALGPIHRITQTARMIGKDRDFKRRVEHEGPRDEVGELALTFNDMLAELESGYRQLEGALQSQRRFVADASHELRTPLTTVRGNMELLRRQPPIEPDVQVEVLTDAIDEVDRLIRLVNQLLTLARADAGQIVTQEPVELRPLMLDIFKQVKLIAPSSRIEFDAPPGTWVMANRDVLKQVLLILVDNALVHTPQDTHIALNALPGDETVDISVSDTGPGIAADALPHIFERFYRGQFSRTGEGAGLGLSIAKELVETQDGSIGVASTPGAGTTFTVRLHRAAAT